MFETKTILYEDDKVTLWKSNLNGFYLRFKYCDERFYLPNNVSDEKEIIEHIEDYKDFCEDCYRNGFKDGFVDGRNQLKRELKNIFCEEE